MMKKSIEFIGRHPDIAKWLEKHPKTVNTFRKRLDATNFFGFPLTLLVASAIGCLWIITSVIQDYIAKDPLIAADVRITNLLFAIRSVPGVEFFYKITLLGSPVTGALVICFITAIFLARKQWITAITAMSGFLIAEGITSALKLLLHRTRPDFLLRAIAEDSYSLPSGHATTAAFVFGFIGYLSFLRFSSKKARVSTFLLVAGSVLAVDFSRMYLGVHYFSDVIAGNAIGLLALLFVIILDQWLHKAKEVTFLPLQKIMIIGSIVIVALGAFFTNIITKSPWVSPGVHEIKSIEVSEVLDLFSSGSLPSYTETLIGEPQEPISFVLIVPDSCLEADFAKAGWTLAVPVIPESLYKIGKAAIFNNSYTSAPMTPSFYNERPHDFGFEKPTLIETVRQRNHARFWETFYTTPEGRVVVGTASLDTGVKWGITHSIAPDIDTERDELIANLVDAGVIKYKEEIKHFVSPTLGQNFTTDFFFTNGDAVLLKLASCE